MIEIKVTAMWVEKGYTAPLRVRLMRKARRALETVLDLVRLPNPFKLGEGIRRGEAFALGLVSATVSGIQGGPAIQAEQKFLHMIGTMTLSGNYPGAPGDTFDITLATLPAGWTLPAIGNLIIGWAGSVKAAGPSGFSYTILPGTTLRNATVDVQQGGGANQPNGEIPTSAYPVGVTGDLVQFEILLGIA